MTNSNKKVKVYPYMDIKTETYPLCVAFSPIGNLVAVGTKEKTVIILDEKKLVIIQKLQLNHSVYAVEWSPDGKVLATGGIHLPIILWNTETWEQQLVVENSIEAMNLSWSSDGKYLVSGSFSFTDDKPYLDIWQTKDWLKIQTRVIRSRYVAFSPDSKYLAIQYELDGIEILSVPDFNRVAFLDFSDSEKNVDIYSPSWNSNGKYIAASCGDGRIRIWKISDWSVEQTLQLHDYWKDAEYRVAFSPNNRFLVSGGQGSPKLISIETWQVTYEFDDILTEDVLDFSWHPSSKYLAIASQHDHCVVIFEIE